jgi:hypothetical protein
MRSRARPGVLAAAATPRTASPAASRPTGLRLIAAMLIAAAALDLTRCSLVLMTFRHVAPAVGLVAAGIGAAAVSLNAARGYQAGQRWATWAALLIGVTSAPQASASGFHNPYTIPDVATAAIGVLLAVTILATGGPTGQPVQHLEIPCVMSRDGRLAFSPEQGERVSNGAGWQPVILGQHSDRGQQVVRPDVPVQHGTGWCQGGQEQACQGGTSWIMALTDQRLMTWTARLSWRPGNFLGFVQRDRI